MTLSMTVAFVNVCFVIVRVELTTLLGPDRSCAVSWVEGGGHVAEPRSASRSSSGRGDGRPSSSTFTQAIVPSK